MKPAPPVTSRRIVGEPPLGTWPGGSPPGSRRLRVRVPAGRLVLDGSRARSRALPGRHMRPALPRRRPASACPAAQGAVGPAGGGPGVAVEGVASVEHPLPGDDLSEGDRVELAVLL